MWLQGPWSDAWPKMAAFLNVTQVYLYLSPPVSPSASFAFEDDMPVGFISSSVLHHGVYPWCHAEGESFPHLCLCGLVSTQPGVSQASRAVFGSWLSDDLLMTSGVMGQKMGSPLLGTWRYPSSSPFSTGKEPACFCLSVFWRGFQLGVQMNLFQRCCLSGLVLWIIEL